MTRRLLIFLSVGAIVGALLGVVIGTVDLGIGGFYAIVAALAIICALAWIALDVREDRRGAPSSR